MPIVHSAYYIDNPFVLNYLNANRINLQYLSELERNVIHAITDAQMQQSKDKMADIFETVANKEKLDTVREMLQKAFCGETVIKNGIYYYHEGKQDIDFRNLSTGLKSFALIERLLESGKLKTKDVLILDEPEIHLHPEWQIIYAELIVVLQKVFDLTILMVTHSFHFLESVTFFMKKYGISDRGNYYTPELSDGGIRIQGTGDAIQEMQKNLSSGTFHIADLEFEYNMEHEDA